MKAVDRSWQGKGLGSDLAIDALSRVRNVSSEAGIRLVMLDVIDDGGDEAFARRMEFCRRLGFQSLKDRPDRLFMTIGTIRAMFGDGLCRWGARRAMTAGRWLPCNAVRRVLAAEARRDANDDAA